MEKSLYYTFKEVKNQVSAEPQVMEVFPNDEQRWRLGLAMNREMLSFFNTELAVPKPVPDEEVSSGYGNPIGCGLIFIDSQGLDPLNVMAQIKSVTSMGMPYVYLVSENAEIIEKAENLMTQSWMRPTLVANGVKVSDAYLLFPFGRYKGLRFGISSIGAAEVE